MNNEKQHSEYKIIETVATPTFDGVSVETHPEDQLEGGDTPKQETQKIAVKLPGGANVGLMCGTLSSDKVFNVLTGGDSGLVATESGIVLNYAGPGLAVSSIIIELLSNYNLEATEVVQTIVDYPIGAEIPQWEQYEQYK